MGLELVTPLSRVTCSTDWASHVLQDKFFLILFLQKSRELTIEEKANKQANNNNKKKAILFYVFIYFWYWFGFAEMKKFVFLTLLPNFSYIVLPPVTNLEVDLHGGTY